MAQDSSDQLQIAPPEREEDSNHSKESPRLNTVIYDPHSPNQHSNNTGASSSPINGGEVPDQGNSKQPPKWWLNTIEDLKATEMIEG